MRRIRTCGDRLLHPQPEALAPRQHGGSVGRRGLLQDHLDRVAQRPHAVGRLVVHLDPELVLEREDDVHQARRVDAEVLDDPRARRSPRRTAAVFFTNGLMMPTTLPNAVWCPCSLLVRCDCPAGAGPTRSHLPKMRQPLTSPKPKLALASTRGDAAIVRCGNAAGERGDLGVHVLAVDRPVDEAAAAAAAPRRPTRCRRPRPGRGR